MQANLQHLQNVYSDIGRYVPTYGDIIRLVCYNLITNCVKHEE